MTTQELRVDGESAPWPASLSPQLEALKTDVARLSAVEPIIFAESFDFPGRAMAHAGTCVDTTTIRGHGSGPDHETAIAAALDDLGSNLEAVASIDGSERLQVAEFMVQSCRFPLSHPPADAEAFARLCEERFIPHLSDEEALRRARAGGEPYFIHAGQGSHELRVLLHMNGAWLRIDEVESLGWRRRDLQGEIELIAEDGSKHLQPIPPGCLFGGATIPEVVAAWQASGLPFGVADIGALRNVVVLARTSMDEAMLVTYEYALTRLGEDAGPFGVPAWAWPRESTAPKRERLAAILICPACRAPLGELPESGTTRCACGQRLDIVDSTLDFLNEGAAVSHRDEDASRNPAAKQLLHDLRLNPSGLVLNAGAGDTPLCHENLVNLEIERYPNTDIVADGQRMPFVDDSFDMVFSQSVIEHVPDPFAYASELRRVLKPGGMLFIDAPFMAPYHGYPNHFFNPTQSGLRQLFDELDEIGLREGPHHEPHEALSAIFEHFYAGLRTDAARQALLSMTVGEFFEALLHGGRPEVTRDLDRTTSFHIAAGFAFYGRKPKS